MASKALPSPEVLRQLLRYEPETGKLFWQPRPFAMFANEKSARTWNTRFAGQPALTADDGKGYRSGTIFGRTYVAHRVIWLMQTGCTPRDEIDHINTVRSDNRWANLREATRAENQRNQRVQANNTSGHKGVSLNQKRARWMAKIKVNGKTHSLGWFKTKEEAVLAYARANAELHGDFGRLA